ncbi:MAG: hypothetical protein ABSG68_23515 [Thermoguttaceae bacterium]
MRRLIAGKRFRAPAGADCKAADQWFARIEDVWRDNENFCRKTRQSPYWTHIALWAAEHIRKGTLRVPLPPIDDILASYDENVPDWPVGLKIVIDQYLDVTTMAYHYPPLVDGLTWDEAKWFYEEVTKAFPSVNWMVPPPHYDKIVDVHEKQARLYVEELAKVKNEAPPAPSTPLVAGTFHEALSAYEEVRRKDFILPDGSFDGSGHHMLGIIRASRERMGDFLLAELDLTRCQTVIDFWRSRPANLRTDDPLSKKTCTNYLGEIRRFTVLTYWIAEHGIEQDGHGRLVFLTTCGTILGPMTGAISRDCQSCCLKFSLSLLPYCGALLAIGTIPLFVRLPFTQGAAVVRLAMWVVGLLGWFLGGILSFGHALT